MDEYSYHGIWTCSSCGTDGLTNNKLFCPNCGTPIPMCPDGTPDTRKPDPADIPNYIIRDQAELDRIARQEGVWTCRFCESVHLDNQGYCTQCGASKDGVQRTVAEEDTDESITYTGSSTGYSGGSSAYDPPLSYSSSSHSFDSSYSLASEPAGGLSWARALFVLVIIAVISVLGIWAYREFVVRTTIPAEIQSIAWQRVQAVEVYRWVDDHNQSGCPESSRSCTSGREVVGQERYQSGSHQEPVYDYRTVQDPPSCSDRKNPDGSYTHSCSPRSHQERYQSGTRTVLDYAYRDVYGTVYRYQIQQWVFNRNLTTSGSDWNAVWPSDYVLGTAAGEPERLGGRSESYSIVFLSSLGQTYPWQSSSEAEWRQFEQDVHFTITLNGNGGLVSSQIEDAE